MNEKLVSVFIESSSFGGTLIVDPYLPGGGGGGQIAKQDRKKRLEDCLKSKAAEIAEDYALAVKQAVTTAAATILIGAVVAIITFGFASAASAGAGALPAAVVAGIAAAGSSVILGKGIADASEKAALAAKRAYDFCQREFGELTPI